MARRWAQEVEGWALIDAAYATGAWDDNAARSPSEMEP